MEEIFDEWPERYEQWFQTPTGRLVEEYEKELIFEMAQPGRGEKILDAGCGTGVFTRHFLIAGARVIGLDISLPMLRRAKEMLAPYPFQGIQGDMRNLPFPDNRFDKFISITAIEFIEDAKVAVLEAFRVTKPGGVVVVATLNRLSPWASRRKEAARKGHPLFKRATFRSPDELRDLAPVKGTVKTVIHFQKDDDPLKARNIEAESQKQELSTGAFVSIRWIKPEV
jgi:ubiquinone/menaquinone biosynthesis C-methylase UbiE